MSLTLASLPPHAARLPCPMVATVFQNHLQTQYKSQSYDKISVVMCKGKKKKAIQYPQWRLILVHQLVQCLLSQTKIFDGPFPSKARNCHGNVENKSMEVSTRGETIWRLRRQCLKLWESRVHLVRLTDGEKKLKPTFFNVHSNIVSKIWEVNT